MSKIIIYTNDLSGVSICFPVDDSTIEEIQIKDIPIGKQSYIIDSQTLPELNYDFFNAWEQVNGIITVNLFKAKELTKTRLRIEREPLLTAQDVLFQRAQENGSSTVAIIAEKNRLRNITLLADNAQTLDALRAIKC